MISEDRKKHIFAVAQFLKQFAIKQNMSSQDVEDLFVLGMLHDIGYEFLEPKDYSTHNIVGGEILKKQGYKYWQEVYFHGAANCEYKSKFLDLLNWADMRVDSVGKIVTMEERLEDISKRHNKPIQNLNAYYIAKQLKQKGYE